MCCLSCYFVSLLPSLLASCLHRMYGNGNSCTGRTLAMQKLYGCRVQPAVQATYGPHLIFRKSWRGGQRMLPPRLFHKLKSICGLDCKHTTAMFDRFLLHKALRKTYLVLPSVWTEKASASNMRTTVALGPDPSNSQVVTRASTALAAY